jgi:hypothetical protein
MRTITLEEHYVTPAFLNGPGREMKESPGHFSQGDDLLKKLLDIGEGRVREMDAAGIDVQVLSLTYPGVQQLEAAEAVKLARETNDYLAAAVKRHPGRFAGFVVLPAAAPDKAADELERMVKEHGFVAGYVNGHTNGRYLDDKFFSPLLERAEALKVPIYIHPTMPPKPVVDAYYSGFGDVTPLLARAGWGWHIETAVHVLRMVVGGAFDRFPGLQVIIGHMGEGIPFMLPRINKTLTPQITKLDRPAGDYFRENVYYTFSGFNFTQTFLDLFLEVGADRIMFSADYPYGSMTQARAFLDHIPVSPADRERIAHGNAERLLRI